MDSTKSLIASAAALRRGGEDIESLTNVVFEADRHRRGRHGVQRPRKIDGQRAPALRFGDVKAQALLDAPLMFVLVARSFTNKDLRRAFVVLLGQRADEISSGRMSYELRRLRLHGLIERLPKTHRYRLTDAGLATAMFYTPVLRPGMATTVPPAPADSPASLCRFTAAETAVNSWCDDSHIIASRPQI